MQKIVMMLVALMCLGCTSRESAPQEETHGLCGAYSEESLLGEYEQHLFDSICTANALSLRALSVSRQVVAGTNYKYVCEDEQSDTVRMVVFVPLPCYDSAIEWRIEK